MPNDRRIALLAMAAALTFGLFSAAPQIDLAATSAFYQAGQGFALEGNPFVEGLRKAIWGASILLVLVAGVGWAATLLTKRQAFGIGARLWGFVLLLYVLGPGLLVEWGLKGHWGRARPAQVVEFGGTAHFTPPYVISDQCLQNCSFVGGESAGATALAIGLWLILAAWRPGLSKPALRLGQGVALALPVAAGLQRLATGRHFLSDVLLSVLLIGLLAAILARVMRLSTTPAA